MRTETRSRIVAIVTELGSARPVELVRLLGITPQAVHRHLRVLVDGGVLEVRGRGPQARYFLRGAPRLDAARAWFGSRTRPAAGPSELVCETRDVFAARLGRLAAFEKSGLDARELALVISAAGEVGNNCFDHNLGNWRDVPGCWFEAQATSGRLWICISDRGQGVLRTLSRADPKIRDEQTALVAAFERVLSGRAPENRGNGLKFVRNVVSAGEGRGLACRSGAALIHYGALGPVCREELIRFSPAAGGTATLLLWSLR